MNKALELLLGLAVGFVAFFIYVSCYGIAAAYIPINYQTMTKDMTQDTATFVIQAYQVFESLLAALPMALAAFTFMFLFKLKATLPFLISSMVVFLGSYIFAVYEVGTAALNIFFILGVAAPCALLWFSLSAPNQSKHSDALPRAGV